MSTSKEASSNIQQLGKIFLLLSQTCTCARLSCLFPRSETKRKQLKRAKRMEVSHPGHARPVRKLGVCYGSKRDRWMDFGTHTHTDEREKTHILYDTICYVEKQSFCYLNLIVDRANCFVFILFETPTTTLMQRQKRKQRQIWCTPPHICALVIDGGNLSRNMTYLLSRSFRHFTFTFLSGSRFHFWLHSQVQMLTRAQLHYSILFQLCSSSHVLQFANMSFFGLVSDVGTVPRRTRAYTVRRMSVYPTKQLDY